jgi:choline dehydrogenase-like flavoprotein
MFSADRPGQPLHPFSGFTASVCQLRPESRGSVMIRSSAPEDHPAITANYLDAEVDRQCIVAGLQLTRRLAKTQALEPYIAEEIEPGPEALSDDDMLAHARARGSTIFHPTSTCTMGPAGARNVVGPSLKVHGIESLRVADASIMPTVVSGNTNAACIMIGEKASDMMLGT